MGITGTWVLPYISIRWQEDNSKTARITSPSQRNLLKRTGLHRIPVINVGYSGREPFNTRLNILWSYFHSWARVGKCCRGLFKEVCHLKQQLFLVKRMKLLRGLMIQFYRKFLLMKPKMPEFDWNFMGKCCLDFNCAVDTSIQASFSKRDHSGGEFLTIYQ